VLPTPSFFYGLYQRQEISVTIELGKTLIIRLVNVSEPEKDGRRTVTVELNGMTRETFIADKQLAPKAKLRPKADLKNAAQVPAPIPGLIASIAVSVGHKVSKGDKLLMLEAMKMQTTISAPVDGVVDEIHVALNDTVESKDLLLTLR
jgi:pyruvate carboxylase